MLNWLSKIFPSKPQLIEGHEMEIAFYSGSIPYRRFINDFNIPYLRAMATLDIYVELEERTNIKYHKSSYNLIIELLKQGDNIEAGRIANNALERMDNICNMDLVYKLASVLYIAPDENPYTFDYEYSEQKIKRWQKDNDIESFFLQTPLSDYMPSFDGSEININLYTKAQRIKLSATLKRALSVLSGKSKNKELILTLESQIKELEELLMIN